LGKIEGLTLIVYTVANLQLSVGKLQLSGFLTYLILDVECVFWR